MGDEGSTPRSVPEQLDQEHSERSNEPREEGTISGDLDLVGGETGVAPEDRMYTFDIKQGTYRQLVDDFAWQTGLGLIGEPPRRGSVDLVTSEELSFDEALAQVRMVLFASSLKDPYWLLRHETHLEVLQIDDALEVLPDDRMFRSLEEFQTADLSPDELALVIFTPPSGSLSDLNLVRDFMPEYVRVTALEDQNAVTIFALVKDIEKYSYVSELLGGGGEDPRMLEIIDVEHILPSKAVEKLESLMDLGQGGRRSTAGRKARRSGRSSRTPRRKARTRTTDPFTNMDEPEISVVADDVRRVIIVRAMADTIDEIRLLLPYLDVGTSTDFDPVIIDLEHASAEKLMPVLRGMLEASMGTTAGTSRDKRRQSRTSRRSRKGKRAARSAGMATMGGISLMAHPTNDAIIVMGDKEDTDLVREFVELLDMKDRLGPIRIELEYAEANVLSNTLTELLGGKRRRGSAGSGLPVIVADTSGEAIWVEGSETDLDAVQELVALLDSADSAISLHIARLESQTPSLVASVLRSFDDVTAASKSSSRSSRRRSTARSSRRRTTRRSTRSRTGAVSKFTPDDDQNRLFVLCTEEEWAEYLPIIDQLEDAVGDEQPFARLTLTHISPQEAIDKLTTLFSSRDAPIRFAVAENDILVMGAGPSQVEAMESLLAEIDKPSEQVQRTFEIQHTDPAEMMRTIQALVGDETATRPKRARGGRSRSRRAPSRTAASGEDLTIVQIASQLVVRTTPEKMEQVAVLIDELDVAQQDTELRVYDDFPPRTDIEGIADTVSAVVNGTVQDSRTRRKRRNQPPPRVTLIPQPASRRLIVRGDPSAFVQVEEILSALTGEQQPDNFEDLSDATFFDVEHADPAELVEAIEPLLNLKVQEFIATGQLDDEPIRSVTSARHGAGRRSRSMDQNPHYYMAPDTRNMRIVLAAPQIVVDQVAELIEELDAPVDIPEDSDVTFVEVAHANPTELVETIDPILGLKVQEFIATGQLDDEPIRSVTRTRRRAGRRSRSTGESPYYYMAPDTRNQRIVLAAPQIVVDQATELIEEFDQPVDTREDTNVTFVDVLHADPAELVEAIEPLLNLKVQEFIATGQLDDEPIHSVTRARRRAGRRPKSTGENPYYYMAPDTRNRRIVLAAAQVVLDEATRLIEEFDLLGDAERMIVRTVELTRTDPPTVIATMGKILGASTRGARRKRGQRSSRPGSVTTDSLTIRAGPSGGGVVLHGFSDEVEQAAGMIEQLDALSTSGRGVNVYHVEHADVENVAKFIMSVVDSSAPKRGRSRSRRAPQRLPEEDEFSTSRTWSGRDVYIQADLIGKVLIVAASQSKLSEIDGIIDQLDTEEVSAVLNDTAVPKLLYELEHVEAFDAAFEIEAILNTLWEPSNEIPTVDVGPFGNMLIIRYPDEDRFPEIEDLITKYVDKPDPYRDRIIRRSFRVPRGMTAQEAVKWFQENHPELDIEVEDISEAEDYGVEEIKPRRTSNP